MRLFTAALLAASLCPAPALTQAAPADTPAATTASVPADAGKRINRAIELLEQGQPVYYTTVRGGAGYDQGRIYAATQADYITYEMEHGALDFSALREFMRGLIEAGPTRTGHRTPAVIATLPIQGDDPVSLKANSWVIQQALATGIHGLLLCQAENVEAVQLFVESARYPFAPGVDASINHRGSGSQAWASEVWGVSPVEYLRLADTWPLNPDGEIMLGIKIENPRATANAEALTQIKGLTFAEWGPGDQAFYLVGRPTVERVTRDADGRTTYIEGSNIHIPSMVQTRARILAATKAANIYFLNACPEDDVINQLNEGTMICTGGETPAATIGRTHTGRPGPW
jgi:4-hydroxy-2-oxoheptanedioate aldolase